MALLNELQQDDKISKERNQNLSVCCTHDFAGSEQNSVRSLNTEREKGGERKKERKKEEALHKLQYYCKFWDGFCAEIHSKQNKREWSSALSLSLSLSHFCVHFIGKKKVSVALQHHHKQRDFLHTFYRQREGVRGVTL
jgi:hypothetical protein